MDRPPTPPPSAAWLQTNARHLGLAACCPGGPLLLVSVPHATVPPPLCNGGWEDGECPSCPCLLSAGGQRVLWANPPRASANREPKIRGDSRREIPESKTTVLAAAAGLAPEFVRWASTHTARTRAVRFPVTAALTEQPRLRIRFMITYSRSCTCLHYSAFSGVPSGPPRSLCCAWCG